MQLHLTVNHSSYCALGEEDYSVRPATNSMPVFIKGVRCSGRELGLLECSFNRGSSSSDHTKDVAVKCRKRKISNVYTNYLQGIKMVMLGITEMLFIKWPSSRPSQT